MTEWAAGEIDIAASRADVLAVLADFDAYPEWVGQMTSARVLERDAEGRGRRVAFELSNPVLPARYTLDYEYLAAEGGMSWTYVEGNLEDLRGSYRLEPNGSTATHVRYDLEVGLPMPVPGFVKRQAARQIVRTALGELKRRVEADR